MKIKFFKIAIFLSISIFASCELDNYSAPDGKISGRIIDKETGELVETDIIEGTTLKLLEHGYANVTPQYLRVKNDGTYVNSLLFRNTYTILPDKRNFVQVESQDIEIGKNTELNFEVQPYIRIKNVNITKDANNVIATFNLEQTTEEPVAEIALYAHTEPNVGEAIYNIAVKQPVNRAVDDNELFKLVINVAKYPTVIKAGSTYFFRVGAKSTIGGAKNNYAPCVKIEIDEILPEVEPEGTHLDRCESIDGWGGVPPILDTDNPQEGSASVRFNAGGGFVIQKVYDLPVNSNVSLEYGVLQFDLYISDTSLFNWNFAGEIEITSSGGPDAQELHWNFTSERRLMNGWNRVVLPFSSAEVTGGSINLEAINFFRIYHLEVSGPVEIKIDNIKLYEEY